MQGATMNRPHFPWRCAVAALLAAAALTACENSNTSSAPSPTPPATPQAPAIFFSSFVEQVYATAPNTTPVDLDNVNLIYDVNDDPQAFDTLLGM
jgi:hypothetical protein